MSQDNPNLTSEDQNLTDKVNNPKIVSIEEIQFGYDANQIKKLVSNMTDEILDNSIKFYPFIDIDVSTFFKKDKITVSLYIPFFDQSILDKDIEEPFQQINAFIHHPIYAAIQSAVDLLAKNPELRNFEVKKVPQIDERAIIYKVIFNKKNSNEHSSKG